MTQELLAQIFAFSTLVNKLKELERFKGQFYWKDYPQLQKYQSVADHSWRLATLVMLFSDKLSTPFDIEKAMEIALIHDIPEVLAGDESPLGNDGTGKDTYAFNEDKRKRRQEKEAQAAQLLFSHLPPKDALRMYNLWISYEKQDCFEAKLIKSLDKIEGMMQVFEYTNGHMFRKHLEFTIEYGSRGCDIDPVIEEFAAYVTKKLQAGFQEFIA